MIGGDIFENNLNSSGNRLLPDAKGRIWYEADINLESTGKRSGNRLLYSNDGLMYTTTDHYKSITFLGTYKE